MGHMNFFFFVIISYSEIKCLGYISNSIMHANNHSSTLCTNSTARDHNNYNKATLPLYET